MFTIIDNTKDAMDKFARDKGNTEIVITPEDIDALIEGKCLAFFDGEYSHFITMKPTND